MKANKLCATPQPEAVKEKKVKTAHQDLNKKDQNSQEDEATDLVGACSPAITKKHTKHKKNKSIEEDEATDLVGAFSPTITKKHKKHKKNKVSMQSAYDPLGVAEARPSVASLLENETSEPQKHKTKRSKAERLLENETSEPLEKKVKLCHDSGQKAVDKPVVTTTGHGIFQGQWQGQLFENNERQNKFLRLLGGMKGAGAGEGKKKGLFGSLGSSALTLEKAADLNSRLEDQYNKALHFKLTGKKGSGFGFTPDPAEGKKFHIDVNKTNSVQFDD